ncbi:carboxypeptidase-like regulatory domain-containing protein [Engelhardtia mirabilis]|uniref:Carboxypeptidase regulatory-like domain-containing protein n=1 Tax=Engelhardtia mirabilis TaxID=2528011 RepID=A0A518BF60_9BACT|nr:hypothetical protein Pla133_06760 [Planctomycetes bacterium Pla133]QDU99936.1 hypothetical protein Pla86_06750 [Planctomycetes bacterium Pla86]
MKPFHLSKERLRHDAAWSGDDGLGEHEAWVGRLARALLRRARHEVGEDEAEGLWQSGLDPRAVRIDGRSPVDAARSNRLVVQAVMELPSSAREAVLARYRDNRRPESIARERRQKISRVDRELSDALDTIGSRVRQRTGGGRAVYLAGLALLERELQRPRRRLQPLAPLLAAAIVLAFVGAMLFERDLGDRPGPEVGAEGEVARSGDRRAELNAIALELDTVAGDQAAGSEGLDELAATATYGVQIVGQVRDESGLVFDASRRSLGYLRAKNGVDERITTINEAGRFSLNGLSGGEWTLTAQIDGYVTATRKQVFDESPESVFVELLTRRAPRVDVRVFVPIDGEAGARAVHSLPGSADDWAITHGLAAAMTAGPAPRRLPMAGTENNWNRLAEFERMAPADMARPALIGSLVAERPASARWVHLMFGEYVLDSQPWQPGLESVRFDLDLARLDGMRADVALMLKSLLNLDVTGAEVYLYGPNGEVLVRRLGPDGGLDISGLPPGSWTLEIWLRGHGRLLRALNLEPGSGGDVEEIEMGGSIPLSGSVFDLAGNPVGALLRALPFGNVAHPFVFDYAPTTNAYPLGKGKFDFGEELSGGSQWVVVLDEPGYALKAEVVGEFGAKVDFQAEVGHDVTMTWSAADVTGGTYALLRDSKGLPLKAFAITEDLGFAVQLMPDTYNLVLWQNNAWGKQIPFVVNGDGTKVPVF